LHRHEKRANKSEQVLSGVGQDFGTIANTIAYPQAAASPQQRHGLKEGAAGEFSRQIRSRHKYQKRALIQAFPSRKTFALQLADDSTDFRGRKAGL